MDRIQKILAAAGIASRRKCEELIRDGRVKKNGKIAVLGEKAEAGDRITVDGRPVQIESKVYIILNKPQGFLSAARDMRERTVLDLVPVKERIYPVGRLDKDAEGLILLTNDGELANLVMHPRYETTKEYYVETDRNLRKEDETKINYGVRIDGKIIHARAEFSQKSAEIEVHEGQKHVVKRIFESLGYKVTKLVRTKIATLKLDIPLGKYRHLTPKEVSELRTSLAKQLARLADNARTALSARTTQTKR